MLEVGKITNTHGLRGEVKVIPWTDSFEVFERIKTVAAKTRGADITLNITEVRRQKNNLIVRFSGIDSIEQAEKLKGCIIAAERSELGELEEGVYYIADLIGVEVANENGEVYGKIKDVLQTGSNDVYVVPREGRHDLLIPVTDGVVLEMDIAGKHAVVRLPEGLEEL